MNDILEGLPVHRAAWRAINADGSYADKALISTVPPREFSAAGDAAQANTYNNDILTNLAVKASNCDGAIDLAGDPTVANSVTPNVYLPSASNAILNSNCSFDGTHLKGLCYVNEGYREGIAIMDAMGTLNQCTYIPIPISYQSINSAAFTSSTQAIPLWTLQKKQQVCGLKVSVTTAFAGTSMTAATASVGDSTGTTTQYSTAQNLFATGVVVQSPNTYVSTNGVVQLNLTTTGATPSAFTAGAATIELGIIDIP